MCIKYNVLNANVEIPNGDHVYVIYTDKYLTCTTL